MSRINDRQKAIELRKQGKTYGQIRKELGVVKSTLSGWLGNYPLSEKQLDLLKLNKKYSRQVAAEKNRITKQKKHEKRLNDVYQKEKKRWSSLAKKELQIAGIFLYWGEGNKRLNGSVVINNTDPKVMQFTLYWYVFGLHVPKEKIKVDLQLYSDMNVEKAIDFWSKTLNLPVSQFRKPYVKKSTRLNIDHKGYGHGTCGLTVNNVSLKEKIMMAIKAISDYHSDKVVAMI